MKEFPAFMKHPANRIAASAQSTAGVEGYVFDGADGSQMAFWTCAQTATSSEHAHEFDEYLVVVEGCYTLIIAGKKILLRAGEQYFVPPGSTARRPGGSRNKNDSCFWWTASRTRACRSATHWRR